MFKQIYFLFYSIQAYKQEHSIIDKECADSLIRKSQTLTNIFISRKSVNDQVYEEVSFLTFFFFFFLIF